MSPPSPNSRRPQIQSNNTSNHTACFKNLPTPSNPSSFLHPQSLALVLAHSHSCSLLFISISVFYLLNTFNNHRPSSIQTTTIKMQSVILAVAAMAVGASAWGNSSTPSAVDYTTTEVVTSFTTYCPAATTITTNNQTYTATSVSFPQDHSHPFSTLLTKILPRQPH